MTKHIVLRVLAGLVLLAALAGIGFFAYNAGFLHGAATNLTPGQIESQPLPFGGRMTTYHHSFPAFGFGCFGILIPLFLFCLAFAALRHMLWGPHWAWGWRHHRHMHGHGPWGEKGPWGDEVPPMVAEWHRRMHENPPSETTDKK